MQITDEGEGMRTKSASSVRWVPVHPRLISIGLKDHIAFRATSEPPMALAFPQWGYRSKVLEPLPKDGRGRVSGAYGKRFGVMLRDKLGLKDEAIVFHSFRHRLQDAADNVGMPDSHRRYLPRAAAPDRGGAVFSGDPGCGRVPAPPPAVPAWGTNEITA